MEGRVFLQIPLPATQKLGIFCGTLLNIEGCVITSHRSGQDKLDKTGRKGREARHFFERRQEEEFHERGITEERGGSSTNFSPQAAGFCPKGDFQIEVVDFGYDHITHNAPDLFRTLKLSCVEPG